MAICADSEVQETIQREDGSYIYNGYDGINVISIEIDINGKEGPNIYGRDYFSFEIDSNNNILDPNYNGELDFSNRSGYFAKL